MQISEFGGTPDNFLTCKTEAEKQNRGVHMIQEAITNGRGITAVAEYMHPQDVALGLAASFLLCPAFVPLH